MDNFFYDLNKKLDGIRAKPETAQLNERDLGKHNNATTGFAALAKKTGGGEKGNRIAGAQLAKMRAKGQVEESDVGESAFQAAIGKKKYGDEGMKALQKAGRDHASDKTMSNIRNKYDKYDESQGMADEGNAFGNAVRKAKSDGIQPGEKVSVGGKQYPVKEADPMGLEEKLSAPQLKKFAKLAPPRNKVTFADKIAGAKKEVDEMLGDVAADAMRSAVGHIKNKRSGEMEEGWDDMMKDVKQRAHSTAGMKTGERKRSSTGGEIEKTKTGLRHHARSHDHEDDDKKADDGAPKRKGRPKGPEKKPERVTGKAWKHKSGRVKEGEDDIEDRGEYDREGDMVKDNIHTIRREVDELEKIIGNNENLPEWVEEKLSQAKGMIMAASEYMQTQHERDAEDATGKEGITMGEKAPPGAKAERMVKGIKKSLSKDGTLSGKDKAIAYATTWKAHNKGQVEEEGTDKRDNRAEKAGRKVTKDLEYDMGHKGKDDAKAEKAGRKVAKDIEYDEKKKEKKVDETTTSGSVATAAPNGKAKSGGMSFGKGVYEGINSQVERMITEGMNVSVNMTQGEDGQPHKSITVSAEGEEAENLAQLLRLAGMHQQPEESCPTCGSAPCGCDENVAENAPDWPTNPESSPNAMQYSGGLNGPKSTGQTTTPVIAGQRQRTSTMEENVTIERSLFKLFNAYKAS